MSKEKKNKGLALIELLVVIGIIGVLVGASIGVFSLLRQRNIADVEAQKVLSSLRLAQNRTLASKNFTPHGVYFDSGAGEYINFEGSAFNPGDPNNATSTLDTRVEIANIQLSGGSQEVVFNRISGSSSVSGFIELRDKSDNSQKRTICVEASGKVSITDNSTACRQAYLEYTDGTTDADLGSFPGNSASGDIGQSFTTLANAPSVSKIDLYIRRDGTPSDIFLEIRETSTVGDVLGKSLLVSGAGLPASLSWVRFEFPLPVELAADTQYFLRLRSLPTSTTAFSGASGTVIWGYEHAATAPPAYAGGDAWRFIGAFNTPTDPGQQLGPSDQYDFSFRIFTDTSPPNFDSRHLEFDLGFDLRDQINMTLDFDGGTVTETITIADYLDAAQTEFVWEDTIDVGGIGQTLRIHSLYIDDYDTILHVHRDLELNDVSLGIDIDTADLVDYTAGGTPTKGSTIGSMIYR